MMRHTSNGDTPDPITAGCLAVVGFAGSALVYFQMHRNGRWLIAYGLLWVGTVGVARIYERWRGTAGRFVVTLVEGTFLLAYSVAALTVTPVVGLLNLSGWTAWTVEAGLTISAVAGATLIMLAASERIRGEA